MDIIIADRCTLEFSSSLELERKNTIEINDSVLYSVDFDMYLSELCKVNDIRRIIVCRDIEKDKLEKILEVANHYKVEIYTLSNKKILSEVGFVAGNLKSPLDKGINRLVKRGFDIIFSGFVVFFILSWLCPIIAILIKLDSVGPIVFKQKRTGLLNQEFYCFKFRSMSLNSDSDRRATDKNDDRVTRIGAFIRKTSIDELPQFLNVLIGDMSVVGPRPHMVLQTKRYKNMEGYMDRHYVKPGITGWAQVTGSRGKINTDEDMKKRVKKDIWYINNWSLWLDIKIIFLTIWGIVRGDKQAY